jgi:site-specific DNA-methyltransferase (adenine-specific)
LPPGYAERGFVGGKPLWLMRSLVRDYTRPGDVVLDPCAGSGTTLLAAVIEGRRAIGAECDEETYESAVRRLRRGYTPVMFEE